MVCHMVALFLVFKGISIPYQFTFHQPIFWCCLLINWGACVCVYVYVYVYVGRTKNTWIFLNNQLAYKYNTMNLEV